MFGIARTHGHAVADRPLDRGDRHPGRDRQDARGAGRCGLGGDGNDVGRLHREDRRRAFRHAAGDGDAWEHRDQRIAAIGVQLDDDDRVGGDDATVQQPAEQRRAHVAATDHCQVVRHVRDASCRSNRAGAV